MYCVRLPGPTNRQNRSPPSVLYRTQHFAAYIEDLGFSASFAAIAVGMVGAGSALGRVGLGWAADRLGRIRTFKGALVANAFTMLFWYFTTTKAAILVFAVSFGFAAGAFIALVPAVMSEYYGVENLGSVMGFVSLALVPGSFLGPFYAGVMFDNYGNYDGAILVAAGLSAVAAVLIFFLGPTPEVPSL